MLTHISAPDSEGKVTYTFNTQWKIQVPRRYEVRGIVGRGSYGIVCSAVDSTTGDTLAIKKISNVFGDVVDGKRILREVKLLGFLKHPNVLSLKDLFRPSGPDFSDLYVVTELMSSDMQSVLKSSSLRLTDSHFQYFTYHLLCALRYIHSANVVHRDLKPANILTNSECDLKLCDFGLARGIGHKMTPYVVTRWYRPPELLLVSDDYDASVDLWGVACIAVEMVMRRPLFPGHDYIHQLHLIAEVLGSPCTACDLSHVRAPEALSYLQTVPPVEKRSIESLHPNLKTQYLEAFSYTEATEEENKGDDTWSDSGSGDNSNKSVNRTSPVDYTAFGEERYASFKDFIFKLLKYNPKDRMTAQEALAHPWLQEVRKNCGGEEFETEAGEQFVWDFDTAELNATQLRGFLLNEIVKLGE